MKECLHKRYAMQWLDKLSNKNVVRTLRTPCFVAHLKRKRLESLIVKLKRMRLESKIVKFSQSQTAG
jgi:hypothetical protein